MKRKIISVITTFVLILSSHFSMIYASDMNDDGEIDIVDLSIMNKKTLN